MGGAGPACQFDPQQITLWAQRTGVRFLLDTQYEEAYRRARPFLLEQMKTLLEQGWESKDLNDSEVLFSITKRRVMANDQTSELNLTLPSTFNSFLDKDKVDTWRRTFEDYRLFNAKRPQMNKRDLFVDSSPPLCNIFYLLQVIAPGMLVIWREDDYDVALVEYSRALPRTSWIEEHQYVLNEVIGSTEALLSATKDERISFDDKSTFYDDSENYDTNSADDFAACDQECGYCGRCEY